MVGPREPSSEHRVRFEQGLHAHLMAIDGTWRRDCVVNDISDSDATMRVLASIEGLKLAEFFLLLSSTGLAYRRCSLEWVNGDEIGVSFLRQKGKKAKTKDQYIE
jgi:hypothetical protein